MLKNYLRIAIRNLIKQKGFSIINIIGLSVGLACCILILLFINDEMSYDTYNQNADRICRVTLTGRIGNADFNMAQSCAPLAFTFKSVLPEVENAVRLYKAGIPVIRYKEKVFSEDRFMWADSTIFDVFTLPFIEGNPRTALTKPNTVVITESTAKKYFGNDEAIGKILNADKQLDYIVTGVIKDVPKNSHFHFDLLGSLVTYPDRINDNSWLSNNFHSYLLLKKGVDLVQFQKKVDELVNRNVAPQIKTALGISYDDLKKSGAAYKYKLQPLKDIHLHSQINGNLEPNGDIKYVYIFAIIAFGILLIACINFMNLATARSAMRAKEVGIRKTLGSNKRQLVAQFIFESILMSLIAISIAYFFVELLLPLFNNITGKEITFGLLDNYYTLPALILFAVLVGTLAGSYPAFFLSSIETVTVLKGGQIKGGGNSWMRGTLVVFQFAISIFLFVGTFVVQSQLNYLQNKKLGFNKDQVVLIKKTDDIGAQIQTFKQELRQNPSIISVSNASNYPGDSYGNSAYRAGGSRSEQTHVINRLNTDYNFVDTYQIQMAEGRFFSREHPSDTLNAVVYRKESQEKTVHRWDLLSQFSDFGLTDNTHFDYYLC